MGHKDKKQRMKRTFRKSFYPISSRRHITSHIFT